MSGQGEVEAFQKHTSTLPTTTTSVSSNPYKKLNHLQPSQFNGTASTA